jgi:hypothetical protein
MKYKSIWSQTLHWIIDNIPFEQHFQWCFISQNFHVVQKKKDYNKLVESKIQNQLNGHSLKTLIDIFGKKGFSELDKSWTIAEFW